MTPSGPEWTNCVLHHGPPRQAREVWALQEVPSMAGRDFPQG